MVRVGVVNVDNAVDDLACAQLLHQLARTVDRVERSCAGQDPSQSGAEASVRMPSAFAVIRTVAPWKFADSKTTVLVSSIISEFAPPITPATATGLSLSADGEHLVAQVVIHAVQSLDGLTVAGTADNNAAIGQALVVERMHRLAVLEHNIVGDINDVVDRTNAAGVQTLAHPRRRRLDLDVLDDAGRVARAQVGILDLDATYTC